MSICSGLHACHTQAGLLAGFAQDTKAQPLASVDFTSVFKGKRTQQLPRLTAVWNLSRGQACLLPSYREGYSEGPLVILSLEIGEWDESAVKCWRQAARRLQGLCQQHTCSLVRGAKAQVTGFLKKEEGEREWAEPYLAEFPAD